MREKDLQKWQKCSSVAGNAGCWSGGGVTVEEAWATVSKPTCLFPAYDFRPQLKSHPAVIDVGLASGSGSITQRQDGGKAAECFQFMKWERCWVDDGEGGGREGAFLPRTNLWKALQQMIQIRFMLKCVFTHRDTWAAWPLTFSITFYIAICWSSKEGVSTSPDVPSRFGNIITFI